MDKEIDCEYTDDVVCPYCGHHMDGDIGDGPSTGEQECDKCEKKFDCTPSYSVSYTTMKVDCWNGSPHDFKKDRFWPDDEKKAPWTCKECSKTEWRDQ